MYMQHRDIVLIYAYSVYTHRPGLGLVPLGALAKLMQMDGHRA